jgi:hypothetical protein
VTNPAQHQKRHRRSATHSPLTRRRRGTSQGTKTFTDPRLCAAIVDRLTFGGHIINTGTQSYRLAHARRRTGANSDRHSGANSG